MLEQIRDELLAMAAEDQDMRLAEARGEPGDQEVDLRHVRRLKEIMETHGFPGVALVGEDGAGAAWLIAQHADFDRDFRRHYLGLLETAVSASDASPRRLAYLKDRVLVGEGRPQVYGTQCYADGEWRLCRPLEDPDGVDRLRAGVGLGPLGEYLCQLVAIGEAWRRGMKTPRVTVDAPGPRTKATLQEDGGPTVVCHVEWDPARRASRLLT